MIPATYISSSYPGYKCEKDSEVREIKELVMKLLLPPSDMSINWSIVSKGTYDV